MKTKKLNTNFAFVSGFFPIKNGVIRHPINLYQERVSKLFKTFNPNLPLYIFTTSEGKEILENSRYINGQNIPLTPNIKYITKYQSIFDVPKIAERKEQYKEIADIMQKNSYYNISLEIGSIWNSKIVFLQEVIEIYQKEAKLIFWVDIGAVKTDEMLNKIQTIEWPCTNRIEKIFSFETKNDFDGKNDTKIYTEKVLFWGVVRPFIKPKSIDDIHLGAYDYFVAAAFFGGPREKMISFFKEYWRIHDFLMKKKDYVLREEFVLAAYITMNKNDIFMIDLLRPKCSKYESFIGFISNSNICNYDNSIYVYMTRKGKFMPVPKSLGDWL